MQEHTWVKPINSGDLNVYQYGYERCEPQHAYGPAVRDHYLLHFVHSGKGIFRAGNKTYDLKQGQGFLICPDVMTFYRADKTAPWTYSWIGFNGRLAGYYLKSAGLFEETPVFSYDNNVYIERLFTDIRKASEITIHGQVKMIGILYLLLAELISNITVANIPAKAGFGSKEEYVKNAVLYMQRNFSHKLSVEGIARYIGLNRSYFGAIFKEQTGETPQEFLLKYRMEKAKELMKNHALSIGDVARSTGYDDPLLFSKMFKKLVGVSPSKYKKESSG